MGSKKKKDRSSNWNNKRRKLERKPLEKNKTLTQPEHDSDYDSDINESKSDKVQKLLEPYSKDQLIDFLCDASVKDSSLLEKIRSLADQDVSHRKIFVHGIGWDTTQDTFKDAFTSFGEIEDCRLVLDKNTGRAKGYGFVLYKSRASAAKALKESQKKIGNRFVACQLASLGVANGPGVAKQQEDTIGRKVYVTNVSADIDSGKLREMFAKFGEIEMGPMGFDVHTGKSRGFALFLYKTKEGAKKCLEEPNKIFEGHQLHCQYASKSNSQQVQIQQPVQASALAAAAAAQNLALFSQHPHLNPLYNGMLMNQNPGFMPGAVDPLFQGGLHPMAGSLIGNSGGLGGYGASEGLGLLGGYGAHGYMNPSFSGLQSYSNSDYLGQSSSSRTRAFDGSFPGYHSYMCIKDCPLVGDQGVASLVSSVFYTLKKVKLQGLDVTDLSLAVVGHYGRDVLLQTMLDPLSKVFSEAEDV